MALQTVNKLEVLKDNVETFKKDFPHLADEIQDFYQLCLDEIEAGESEWNEIELCYGSITDLIEENKNHDQKKPKTTDELVVQ